VAEAAVSMPIIATYLIIIITVVKRAIDPCPRRIPPILNIPHGAIIPMEHRDSMPVIPTFPVVVAAVQQPPGMVVLVVEPEITMPEEPGIITGRGGVLMVGDDNIIAVVPMPVGRARRVRRVGVGGIRVRIAWRVLVVRASLLRVWSAGPHPPAEEVCNPPPPVSSVT